MTEYFDTPVLVFACGNHPTLGPHARKLLASASDAVTTPHAVAECFNALTYRLGVPPVIARKLIQANTARLRFQPLTAADYLAAVDSVVDNGQTGDKIYDALHCRAAELAGAKKLHTSNKRDFSPFVPAFEVVKIPVPA